MIDVSYRYKQSDLKGGKMMMDPDTGIITLEGVPVDEHVEMPLPKDFEKPITPAKKVTKSGKA